MNTDCSICLEVLDGINNRLTTDCGHCFHTNCFLQNVSHNGFACPNCRNQLVEEPDCESDDEDEDDYDEDDYDEDEESDDDTSVSVAGPGLESHLLRGFRWLFQRVEEDEDDDEDEDEDDDDYDHMQYQRGHEQYSESHYIMLSLHDVGEQMRQRDITFDDLVALIAFPHKDNAADCAEYTLPKIKELQTKIQEILEGTYQVEESTETTEDAAILTAEEEEDVLSYKEEEEEVAFVGTTIIDLTTNGVKHFSADDILPSFQFFDLTDDE